MHPPIAWQVHALSHEDNGAPHIRGSRERSSSQSAIDIRTLPEDSEFLEEDSEGIAASEQRLSLPMSSPTLCHQVKAKKKPPALESYSEESSNSEAASSVSESWDGFSPASSAATNVDCFEDARRKKSSIFTRVSPQLFGFDVLRVHAFFAFHSKGCKCW